METKLKQSKMSFHCTEIKKIKLPDRRGEQDHKPISICKGNKK